MLHTAGGGTWCSSKQPKEAGLTMELANRNLTGLAEHTVFSSSKEYLAFLGEFYTRFTYS